MELGPDILCSQLDHSRALLAKFQLKDCKGDSPGMVKSGILDKEDGSVELSAAISELVMLRELVHIRREWLRTGSLWAVAQSAAPELCDKLRQRILGTAGLVSAARLAVAQGVGVGESGLASIARAVRGCGICMRLRLLPLAEVSEPFAEFTGFLAAHVPESRADAHFWRNIQKDARHAEELAERDGMDAATPRMHELVDAVALRCIGLAAGKESARRSAHVLRLTVEADFVPAAAEVLRSGILNFLAPYLNAARFRAIRVEPSEGAGAEVIVEGERRGKTVVDVAIESSPRGTAEDCKLLADHFADLTSPFSVAARGNFGISSFTVLSGCVFLSLFLAPEPVLNNSVSCLEEVASPQDYQTEQGGTLGNLSPDRQRLARRLVRDMAEADRKSVV